MNYAIKFKTTRLRYKLTQQQVADKLKIPRTAIVCIEQGTRKLSIEEATLFANFIFSLDENNDQKTGQKKDQ